MSLSSFIEKLQQKPRYVRLQIMWAGAILSTIVIFGFWLWSTASLLTEATNSKTSDKSLQSLDKIKQEMPSLWQSLSAGISNVINTAKEELNSSPSPGPSISPVDQSETERLPIE